MITPVPSVASPYADELASIPTVRLEARVLGATARYWVYGRDDAPTTIVAVHGFRGEHHGLEPVVAFLDGVHSGAVRVISPDLPGFGESALLPGREHSTAVYAEWLRGFLAAIGQGADTVVLGHSFGSIVTSAAVASGLDVRALILVNPIAAPALSGPRGVLTRLAVFYYWAGAGLPESIGGPVLRLRAVTRVASLAMVKTRSKTLRAWVHDQHDTYFSWFASRKVVLDAFKASVSSDVSTYARQIRVPALLIAADRDDITALPAQYELQGLFADAQLDVIHGVGHLIHYEKPREAAAMITDFLATLGPAS
ncbi:pimeloyl-ACP methyl ester carboxylesterase [Frondihabitans sp. PhB188]|uniref:alpha/beta fold hydrolase n=1 Tax=Frondihabitans sp. PhB188 TaxID=2485200 RepID=UPI000F49543D|nr:alpha/beta hydrolase [Frondihabitans sp. PhB188]ROQ40938.1 pimeloyl-ACP methyl ester carboxylesterase [Frondihabitans sp. PhB188]